MLSVNLTQAKARLGELLDKVEAGPEVLITRRGKAVAHLTPAVRPKKAAPAPGSGQVSGRHAPIAAPRRRTAVRDAERGLVIAAVIAWSRLETMVDESFMVLLPDPDDFDRPRGPHQP